MTKSKHSYLLHIEGKYKIVRNIRQTSRTTCLLLKTDYCPLLRALYNLKSGISSIHKYEASPLNMIVQWPLLLLCVILWFYILADLVPVFTASQLCDCLLHPEKTGLLWRCANCYTYSPEIPACWRLSTERLLSSSSVSSINKTAAKCLCIGTPLSITIIGFPSYTVFRISNRACHTYTFWK